MGTCCSSCSITQPLVSPLDVYIPKAAIAWNDGSTNGRITPSPRSAHHVGVDGTDGTMNTNGIGHLPIATSTASDGSHINASSNTNAPITRNGTGVGSRVMTTTTIPPSRSGRYGIGNRSNNGNGNNNMAINGNGIASNNGIVSNNGNGNDGMGSINGPMMMDGNGTLIVDPLYDPRRYRDDGEDDTFPTEGIDGLEDNDGYLSPVSMPSLPASRSPSPPANTLATHPPPSSLTPIDASLPTIDYIMAIERAADKWARMPPPAARSQSNSRPWIMSMHRGAARGNGNNNNNNLLIQTHSMDSPSPLPGTPSPVATTITTVSSPTPTMAMAQPIGHEQLLRGLGDSTRSLPTVPPINHIMTNNASSPSCGSSPGSSNASNPRRIAFMRLATPQTAPRRRSYLMPAVTAATHNFLSSPTPTNETDAPSSSSLSSPSPLTITTTNSTSSSLAPPPLPSALSLNTSLSPQTAPMLASTTHVSFSLLSSPSAIGWQQQQQQRYHHRQMNHAENNTHSSSLPFDSDAADGDDGKHNALICDGDGAMAMMLSPPSSSLPLFPPSAPMSPLTPLPVASSCGSLTINHNHSHGIISTSSIAVV